jgi:UDP-3-O-[3-hydroxymyristoyl] glucosamine N-acyltransferase
MNDVPAKTDVIGSPAMPVKEFWRATAWLKKHAGRRDS